jgi:hypothetical protein
MDHVIAAPAAPPAPGTVLLRVCLGGTAWGPVAGGLLPLVLLGVDLLSDTARHGGDPAWVEAALLAPWLVAAGMVAGLAAGSVAGLAAGLVLLVCRPWGDRVAVLAAWTLTLLGLVAAVAWVLRVYPQHTVDVAVPACLLVAYPAWRTLVGALRPVEVTA